MRKSDKDAELQILTPLFPSFVSRCPSQQLCVLARSVRLLVCWHKPVKWLREETERGSQSIARSIQGKQKKNMRQGHFYFYTGRTHFLICSGCRAQTSCRTATGRCYHNQRAHRSNQHILWSSSELFGQWRLGFTPCVQIWIWPIIAYIQSCLTRYIWVFPFWEWRK